MQKAGGTSCVAMLKPVFRLSTVLDERFGKKWCTDNDIKANPEQFWSFSLKKQSINEDPRIRKAAALKAAGHTHASIAEALDVSLSTAKRYTRTGRGS
jgi:hypothetical protein